MIIFDKLTRRENEVAIYMLECMTNKEIAAKLNISARTVRFHASNIMKKYEIEPMQCHRVKLILRLARMAGTLVVLLLLAVSVHAQRVSITKSSITMTLTGHFVSLSWDVTTSCGFDSTGNIPQTCVGYNVYRGNTPGSEVIMSSSLITGNSYTDTTVQAGQTYYYTVTVTNSANITSAFSNEVQAVIPGGSGSTISLFTTQVPTDVNNSDSPTSNYELGMKFRSSVSGQITAIRFWKDSKESGTHIGNIWGPLGAKLASVTFTNETASGWQQQALNSSITIAANTTYTVSVNTGNTYYVRTLNGLSTKIINGVLSSIVGTNGTSSSTPGRYPTSTFMASNYFRDIVFSTTQSSMTTSCSFLIGGTLWRCDTSTINIPSGTAIKSVVTSGTLSNTTNGTLP